MGSVSRIHEHSLLVDREPDGFARVGSVAIGDPKPELDTGRVYREVGAIPANGAVHHPPGHRARWVDVDGVGPQHDADRVPGVSSRPT